jgi:hypothetical protein
MKRLKIITRVLHVEGDEMHRGNPPDHAQIMSQYRDGYLLVLLLQRGKALLAIHLSA